MFYDRKNKMGMVGHGLPSSKQKTLLKMINMLGSTPRTVEYCIIPGYRNYEDINQLESELAELETCLFEYCPDNINFISMQSYLEIKECRNVKAYEFAFETMTGSSVSEYVFYRPEDPKKANYRGH